MDYKRAIHVNATDRPEEVRQVKRFFRRALNFSIKEKTNSAHDTFSKAAHWGPAWAAVALLSSHVDLLPLLSGQSLLQTHFLLRVLLTYHSEIRQGVVPQLWPIFTSAGTVTVLSTQRHRLQTSDWLPSLRSPLFQHISNCTKPVLTYQAT